MTQKLTADYDEGVWDRKNAASVVERLARVGAGVLDHGVANGEHAAALVAGDGHAGTLGDVAPVEAPHDQRCRHANGLAVDAERAVDFDDDFLGRGSRDGRSHCGLLVGGEWEKRDGK